MVNRARFGVEALQAVREVWPERLPITARIGSVDLHADGIQFEHAPEAMGLFKAAGLDLADLSLGVNTDELSEIPFGGLAFMAERAARARREVGLPVATSWNLGIPRLADKLIREEQIDLVYLGRPALATPHGPVWGARGLEQEDPSAWCRRTGRGGCATSAATTTPSAGRRPARRPGRPTTARLGGSRSPGEPSSVGAERAYSEAMDVIELIGRICFAAAFVITPFGVVKTADRVAGVPMLSFIPASVRVQVIRVSSASAIAGATMVAVGLWPDLGVLLVLAFLAPVTLAMHRFWEMPKEEWLPRKQKRDAFLTNLSIAGGAILMFVLFNESQDAGIAVLSDPLFGRI